ncbi:MAG: DEAD/DEAH box helicase family protein [Deltaproteobacteria bacterium]|jgi:predicted helicase|nr:DEAD/DEAH box helicase family protein [Deltaproteobacteria bacterium]
MNFDNIINKYREYSGSEWEKGDRFEKLMVRFLKTYQLYDSRFRKVWQWNQFPYKADVSDTDTGIDLVALTEDGEYWAVQCKCCQEKAQILKPAVDSFISASGKSFRGPEGKKTRFSNRLFISTTDNWSSEAEDATLNQDPPFVRISLTELRQAKVKWEELDKGVYGLQARVPQFEPMEHQAEAVEAFHRHFKTGDRGRLILPCGTGKTYAALKIAEKETGGKGLVLFLAPSIALVNQTLIAWMSEAKARLYPVCVCSDRSASERKKAGQDDVSDLETENLALPASTSPNKIMTRLRTADKFHPDWLRVVFSTYQSIEAVAAAMASLRRQFDLIVCDEAHRTTGQTLAGEEESGFVRVHDQTFLPSRRRLYMTATPKIYSLSARKSAEEHSIAVCSMDDSAVYGPEVYRMGFGEAVRKGLLSDYKPLVFTLRLKDIPKELREQVADGQKEITTDDAVKFIGCIHALSKRMELQSAILNEVDPGFMHKAVAFCRRIKDSVKISRIFEGYKKTYLEGVPPEERRELVTVSAEHVDGTMKAGKRAEKMNWLNEPARGSGDCHILTNVRCLSEGVDVPSLDAVIFLSHKGSEIEVVQAVGRVMRRAEGKRFGYVIIPIVVSPDASPEEALNDNATYKLIWDVLNALKAHDDRFNARINQIRFNDLKPEGGGSVLIGGPVARSERGDGELSPEPKWKISDIFAPIRNMDDFRSAIYARLVRKVGSRSDILVWAAEVGQIAKGYIERIRLLVEEPGRHKDEFARLLEDLKNNLNPQVDSEEAIRMLAQHMVTKPVFEALFENYSFASLNPVSRSMEGMVKLLELQSLRKDAGPLERFYDKATGRITALDVARVKEFVTGIDNAAARQKLIVELYDSFFKVAFPDVVERLGVVYTPVELVDFVIRSVAEALKREFGRDISDENVHILDPFTGTGTFITRLIQSGVLGDSLERKYKSELHANEIVLLAYYIGSINIENAYHAAMGEGTEYVPFGGICLTDSFQLYEGERGGKVMPGDVLGQNSARVREQRNTPIMVIMGNPPYSVGQRSANDNAQNMSYHDLDGRIAATYAKGSESSLKKSLYDTYIKAFRWASDRICDNGNNSGIIAFVTSAGWIDGNAMDGMRKCLAEEFSSIYVFNFRGNARTSGELRKMEGGNVFGSGSRAPIAITVLVKNSARQGPADINYCDIGDYLSREQKLEIISNRHDIFNPEMNWSKIMPNKEGDWLNQRKVLFLNFAPIGNKDDKKYNKAFFMPDYSMGLVTNRDAWCYNFSQDYLSENIKNSISFYNQQVKEFFESKRSNPSLQAVDFIKRDSRQFSWDRQQKFDIDKGKTYFYDEKSVVCSIYRPFQKQFCYFNRQLNNCVYLLPHLFPTPNHGNLVICVSGVGVTKESSAIISDLLPDLEVIGKSQCFPRYYYEELTEANTSLFSKGKIVDGYVRHDGITDFILHETKAKYGSSLSNITKDRIFYYVYGLLHSQEYREKFSADLKKMLPRLPLVGNPGDFTAFSDAGKSLAELHLNYESVRPYKAKVAGAEAGDFSVDKMRFGKGTDGKPDKSVIHYSHRIKIAEIPLEAYDYVLNGKSAIEWVMERYQVKIDKDSGIRNDPNDWAKEQGQPRYILDLLLRVITVSLETMKIVRGLPRLKFGE